MSSHLTNNLPTDQKVLIVINYCDEINNYKSNIIDLNNNEGEETKYQGKTVNSYNDAITSDEFLNIHRMSRSHSELNVSKIKARAFPTKIINFFDRKGKDLLKIEGKRSPWRRVYNGYNNLWKSQSSSDISEGFRSIGRSSTATNRFLSLGSAMVLVGR